ncbi:hypothetical protein MMC07_009729 [Pseudocyphellaria aurata]|nr:hypothetical protein [Pseudocyphellaria aurata]
MFLGVVLVLLAISRRGDSQTTVPQYFQTTPELFAGPTATGRAPFLAEINPDFVGPDGSFVPNAPLQTAEPIAGNTQNENFAHYFGQLSPYFVGPGFGVKEYPLPAGADIVQVHMLHRHASRYASVNSSSEKLGRGLVQAVKDGAKFSGKLSFLNTFTYGLGVEVLVPIGQQEYSHILSLQRSKDETSNIGCREFDSGVLHYYDYGHLYDPSSKIIVRTTTQDRMLKSAEYWLAGFFGLEWPKNATLELQIELTQFNNSLGGNLACNNSNLAVALGGTNASVVWENQYLTDAVKRFNALSQGFTWNISDAYYAQSLCAYETVAFGYSSFCDLFTIAEWKGYEYTYDLLIAGNYMFQSPTGRAVGIGWVDEFLARLEHRFPDTTGTQANRTLDSNSITFPLDQSLYFDFSHISTMTSVLTALGLKRFAPLLPTSGPPANQQLVCSYVAPNAGRFDFEIISTPHPVSASRSNSTSVYLTGGPTKYIHLLINQRTLSLGESLPACGKRDDGWCELQTFLKTQRDDVASAQFDYACNGKYPAVPYGTLNDGVPQRT